MLAKLIESILGPASQLKELCVFSVPSEPVDDEFRDEGRDLIIYHTNRMKEILNSLGYAPMPLRESMALAYSELINDGLTGIAMSWGAGMVNVSVVDIGEDLLSFSIASGGDYIDKKAAKRQNRSETIVQAEKESGINLLAPEGPLQKAIVIYYDALINHVIDVLYKKFSGLSDAPKFASAIPIVVSGGTSLPDGFMEKLSAAIMVRDFPFEIKDIRRAANPDPLRSVSNGCLLYAQMELEE